MPGEHFYHVGDDGRYHHLKAFDNPFNMSFWIGEANVRYEEAYIDEIGREKEYNFYVSNAEKYSEYIPKVIFERLGELPRFNEPRDGDPGYHVTVNIVMDKYSEKLAQEMQRQKEKTPISLPDFIAVKMPKV